ncbi:ribonuclease domain-containing protein [Embleya sp. NPDC020630]|uniref:ribonuclease domain-containing protein n=1 Tax=Embleya sp. NPDC020630 TaxID=3363979 RepID=UPI0037AECE17
MSGAQRRNLIVVTVLALVAALALVFALTRGDGGGDGSRPGAGATRAPVASTAAGTSVGTASVSRRGDTASARPTWVPARMRTVAAGDLPAEARETLALIAAGGPFPYSRDGIVFGNREKLLPGRPDGYYHEYTVRTPGSADRGARRIVTGKNTERFYSDDHYASFAAVLP